MNYKIVLIFFSLTLFSCTEIRTSQIINEEPILSKFSNSGFTLVYSEELFKEKIISSKLNQRDLIIFQKNLKKGTSVKIFNPINKKTVIAKVGKNTRYPNFNNSVISIRIATELDLDKSEPYIIIDEIVLNSTFVAKKTKTFEIEKNVAGKAPVESISINDLNKSKPKKEKKLKSNQFNYSIKIADFYFRETAESMVNRVKNETSIKNVKLTEISKNKYRVILGPYSDLNGLQKAYNVVEKLGFENIIILKNE
tara:strand:+ start:826 stop:1584 length:759 start_codon:yes stop_codon:yes gene_type:complete